MDLYTRLGHFCSYDVFNTPVIISYANITKYSKENISFASFLRSPSVVFLSIPIGLSYLKEAGKVGELPGILSFYRGVGFC